MLKNSDNNIYQICDEFGEMSEKEVSDDTEFFFLNYISKNEIELTKECVQDIFALYMCQYLRVKNELFNEKLN